MTSFYLIMTMLMLIQTIVFYKKRDSTKSIFPILEQVAIYEKEKMGKVWVKQRKSAWIWQLLLSGIFFFQYYIGRDMSSDAFDIDLLFMVGMVILLLISFNIILFAHFWKVDRATSASDFKGYTWKWVVFSVVFGLIFTVAFFAFIIFYIIVII